MTAKARLVDMAKSFVILLLALSAILLLLRITLQGEQTATRESGTRPPASYGGTTTPVFLLLTGEDGSHYALKYDNDGKQRLSAQFSAYLGEALGSAEKLTELSAEDFQAALSGIGVFFDYLYPQPLESIATGLGTALKDEMAGKAARRLFLSGVEDALSLCFIDSATGKIYSSRLPQTFSSLREKIAQFPLGNAEFAFQLGAEYEMLDPYFIFSHESTQLRAVTATNPLRDTDASALILSQFGMSPAASQYPEVDGSAVYVDGEKNLRIGSSGRIIFSAQEKALRVSGEGEAPTVNELISFCDGIVQNTLSEYAGEGELALSGLRHTDSSVTINFLYYLNGVPVMLPGNEYAASFQFVEGSLLRAEIYFRSYSLSDSSLSAIPEKQAVALAAVEGGEPVLVYRDNLDSVDWNWIRFKS